MPDTQLVLGSRNPNGFQVFFDNLEIPESIPFGGAQRAVVHALPGGARIVDVMGREDAVISWAGMMLGDSALNRARNLDKMRIGGLPWQLSWSEFSYTVLVQRFEAQFERFYKIPYSISCLVIQDNTSPVTALEPAGLNDAVLGDNATAQDIGAQVKDPPLSGLLATLDSAIKAVSNFATATQSVINSVLTPLAAVQARVKLLITSAGNTALNVTTLGGILPNNPLSKNVGKMLQQTNTFTQMPQLYNLQSVLGRMGGNLSAIGGTGNKTETVAGGNLFSLAQKNYGDAKQWTTLAFANKTADPMLSGVNTVKIPAQPTTQSDGVLIKGYSPNSGAQAIQVEPI